MMFKQKIYLIEWKDIMDGYNSDIIKARDPASAWSKIKRRWSTWAASVLKITLYQEE